MVCKLNSGNHGLGMMVKNQNKVGGGCRQFIQFMMHSRNKTIVSSKQNRLILIRPKKNQVRMKNSDIEWTKIKYSQPPNQFVQ